MLSRVVHGTLAHQIGWNLSWRPSISAYEYLIDLPIDRNQISSGAALGWRIDNIRFWARSD